MSVSCNYELASAVRRINALYQQVPEGYRPDMTGERWKALEDEIDQASKTGDRRRALEAIEAWRKHTERVLASALANAPLEPTR